MTNDIYDSAQAVNDYLEKEDPEKHYFCKETLSEFTSDVEKQMPALAKFLSEAAQAAKDREKHVKSINQSKWFIKLKKGVSDTLKSKCLPLNKKTAEVIKGHQDSLEIRKKKVLACVAAAKRLMEDKKKTLEALKKNPKADRKANAKAIEDFIEGRDYIKAWETFEGRVRLGVKSAIAQEQFAIKVLDDYIRDKNTMKELGEEAYKKFKEEQQKLARRL